MIRIAVDANCLAWGWGGIPKIVDRMSRELVARGARVDLLANTSRPFTDIEGVGQHFRRLKGMPLWREWFVAGWVNHERPAVFWAPESVVPRRLAAPSVVTLHDLAALLFPGIKPWRQRLAFRTAVRRSAHSATALVAVSRTTAADAVRLLEIERERIRVVPPGIDEIFSVGDRTAARAAVGRRFGLTRPFVLAAGAIEPRKGLDVLLDLAAVGARGTREWDVVLAGAPGYRSAELLERARATPGCAVVGPVTDDELVALYRAAEALVAPSLYEGFGLTPLEAMACGTPAVIAADSGGLEEVSEGAAVVVRERTTAGWLAGIELARKDRDQLLERGLRHVDPFRWPAVADAFLGVLEEAASAPKVAADGGTARRRGSTTRRIPTAPRERPRRGRAPRD